jgi:hypothetical protein
MSTPNNTFRTLLYVAGTTTLAILSLMFKPALMMFFAGLLLNDVMEVELDPTRIGGPLGPLLLRMTWRIKGLPTLLRFLAISLGTVGCLWLLKNNDAIWMYAAILGKLSIFGNFKDNLKTSDKSFQIEQIARCLGSEFGKNSILSDNDLAAENGQLIARAINELPAPIRACVSDSEQQQLFKKRDELLNTRSELFNACKDINLRGDFYLDEFRLEFAGRLWSKGIYMVEEKRGLWKPHLSSR